MIWDQSYYVGESTFRCLVAGVTSMGCAMFDQAPPGKYKIRFEYTPSINPNDPFNRNVDIKYAEKEFTIEEKIETCIDSNEQCKEKPDGTECTYGVWCDQFGRICGGQSCVGLGLGKCFKGECIYSNLYSNLTKSDATEMIEVKKIAYPDIFKGILLELNINNNKFTLLESEIVYGYPNYLPEGYPFIARIFSFDNELLGEYGFSDPRIILAERGYTGPTFLDNVNFTLILPYFPDSKTINIYSSTKLMLSIDVIKQTNPQIECLGTCKCMRECNKQGPTYFIPVEEGSSECSVNLINKICCCSGV